ncbi:Thermophilic serine proteinase [Pontiella desulfatans]|uniref:Thermophilic serine proteinase n=1 Tax=Pontiella desulfatans TaxID=2750659 RepID=A0A6C2U966_PONDE|nr:S8 family serine peptidase [Pontiella desulfatans]VGO16051.1 Thermophilic serine proteinase [Pontiella desulfatans]
MRRWIYSGVFALVGLLAWADAGALHLSDLGRSDLADLGVGLPELRRAKRMNVRSLDGPSRTGEVLVKFHGREQVLAFIVDAGEVGQVVALASSRGDVAFAEPNRKLHRQFVPSDPLLGNQWHHDTIGSADAWNWGTGSAGVKVAIVDVPFNLSHPDLAANTMNGWDVVNDAPVYSGNADHASMAAGLAAGVLDNATGIAGAGNCTLVPVNCAIGSDSDIVYMDAAIRWAADNGIRVVNLSWTGADSPVLNLAAEYHRATTDGVVVMAGVNGSGYLDYTNQPCIVAVSMTDSDDELQSHYGPHIDFCAPGYQVYATTAHGYASGSGTSYAAPLVSGILATLFSISPSLSADDALAILKASAKDLGPTGWDQSFGWGRVDFGAAAWLAAATAGSIPDLGMQQVEGTLSGLKVSGAYQPGMGYSLMGATNLDQEVWSVVPVAPQTNGAMVEFSVGTDAGSSFYRMVGVLDF